MKILFVINNFYTTGNGLSGSVRRTIRALREKGLDVRVLSAGQSDTGEVPDYRLPDDILPIFSGVIKKQGYKFAEIDKEVLRQAVMWADVIHLAEPFALQIAVCRMADRYRKPCVATCHIHPENLFASVGLERSLWFNGMTMLVWRDTVFNHCRIVQCPTENVRQRLERWKYKAELRVISNGITAESSEPVRRRHSRSGTIHVLSVGRFSREKDQNTLLNAMKYTRHADRIRLHFAGKGPTEGQLKRKAARLFRRGVIRQKPTFGFYSREQLRALFAISDLYVHSASIEVEGMSCMEAVCTGIVPVIARGKLTAAPQFARSDRSLYPVGDARALAEQIDYWIEHPKERRAEAEKYIGMEKEYRFEDTIAQTIRMYEDAYGI